ncbi:MAG: hypothetical protein KIT43_10260 [Bauldia sp.]|nr:hypothetical protein [Bauldia sp.]
MPYGILLYGGPILAGIQIYAAFKVWQHALRNVTPRVDSRPLAIGMVMFTVGWLIAVLGAAGHYPWGEDARFGNSSFGVATFIFGSPVAFGILLLLGIPGTVLLLRKGRLGYAMGLLLVAIAIAGSAIVVWWRPANPWHATHRLESFLGAPGHGRVHAAAGGARRRRACLRGALPAASGRCSAGDAPTGLGSPSRLRASGSRLAAGPTDGWPAPRLNRREEDTWRTTPSSPSGAS